MYINVIKDPGKVATRIYREMGIPKGATSTGQFGEILSITVDGIEYEYQVKSSDTMEIVLAEFGKLLQASKLVAA